MRAWPYSRSRPTAPQTGRSPRGRDADAARRVGHGHAAFRRGARPVVRHDAGGHGDRDRLPAGASAIEPGQSDRHGAHRVDGTALASSAATRAVVLEHARCAPRRWADVHGRHGSAPSGRRHPLRMILTPPSRPALPAAAPAHGPGTEVPVSCCEIEKPLRATELIRRQFPSPGGASPAQAGNRPRL